MYNIDNTEMTCGGCIQRTHTNNSQRDEPPHTPPHQWLHWTRVLTMVIESRMVTNKSMILLRNRNATPKRNNNERLSLAEPKTQLQNANPKRSATCPNDNNQCLEAISLNTQFQNARTAWEVFKKHPKSAAGTQIQNAA